MRNFAVTAALFALTALIAWFLVGNIWGDRLLALPKDVVIEVSCDTLRVRDVEPIAVETLDSDSTDMRSVYIFADTAQFSRWRAEVVGRDVELRSLTMVERTERQTMTSVVQQKPDWEVALRGSVSNNESWIGVGVQRNFGNFSLGIDAGANPITGAPSVTARGSVTIWKR